MPRRLKGFDFTAAIRAIAADMTERLAELAHIDMSRVAVGVCRTRHRERHGVYAMLTPLRFAGGELHQTRRGHRWRVRPIVDAAGASVSAKEEGCRSIGVAGHWPSS